MDNLSICIDFSNETVLTVTRNADNKNEIINIYYGKEALKIYDILINSNHLVNKFATNYGISIQEAREHPMVKAYKKSSMKI